MERDEANVILSAFEFRRTYIHAKYKPHPTELTLVDRIAKEFPDLMDRYFLVKQEHNVRHAQVRPT